MSDRRSHPPATIPNAADRARFPLAELVAILESSAQEDQPAVVAGLMRDHDQFGLAVNTFADHPADALLGFTAPPEWDAVAVVAVGHDVGHHQRRVRIAVGIDRQGGCTSLIRDLASGDVQEHTDDAAGRLVDVCRRVLGLPTAPPDLAIDAFLHHLWLERLLRQRLADPTRVIAWAGAVAAHPTGALAGAGATPRTLHATTAQLTHELTWADLRRDGVDGSHVLPAPVAAWFDDGSWCRWVLADLPSVEDLMTDLAALLPQSVTAAVLETMAVAACG